MIVDSQTLTVTARPGQSSSERIEVMFSEPADQLSFRAPRGSRFGVRESTLTTVSLSNAAAGPLTPYHGELQLRHNHRRAHVAWVNVADTTGTDEQRNASGLTSVDMAVVTIEAAGGVLEVGGGEGYGVRGDGDNSSQRKLIDGDESLTLSFPHAFTDANLKFRSGKGAAFDAVISLLGDGTVLETRTLSLTTPADKNVTDSMSVVFPEGTNGLRFEAASGQYSLVTSTFYTVFDNATGGNSAPVLELVSPQEGALYSANDDITLTAAASDAEDGDLASQIVWTYTPDVGDAISLGTGASIMVNLPESTGVISASVTDASGETITLGVRVSITTPPPNRFLTVTGSATCELNPLGGAFNANLLFQDDDGNFVNGEIDPLSLAFSDLRVVAGDGTELTTASLSVDSVLASSGDDKNASIVILLDQSGSITNFDRDGQRFEAAKALVERLRPGDEAAIAVIGQVRGNRLTGPLRLMQPFTSDKATLNTVLEGSIPRGNSNVYRGLIASADLFADATNVDATKAVVVISDGEALADVLSFSGALETLKTQNVKVFPIGVDIDSRNIGYYFQFLRWTACASNGLFTELDEPGGFDVIFNALANELVADGTPLATTLSFDNELPDAGSYTLQGTARVEVDGSVVSKAINLPFQVEPVIPGPPVITSVDPASGPTQSADARPRITVSGENITTYWRVDMGVGNRSAFGSQLSGDFVDSVDFNLPTIGPSSAGPTPLTIKTPFGTSEPVEFIYIPEYTPTVVSLTADNTTPIVGETITYTWQVDDLAGDAISCELVTNDRTRYQIEDCRTTTSQSHTFTRLVSSRWTNLIATDENGISRARGVSVILGPSEPTPVLESLSPDKGPTAGGNPVILTGQNFLNVDSVKFGGTEVSFTVDSDTQITATVYSRRSTQAAIRNVVVSSAGGGESNGLSYRFVRVPVIFSLEPTEGFSGDTITMRGSSLGDVDEIRVGEQIADFTINTLNELTFTVPSGNTGPVDVMVVAVGQESNTRAFTHLGTRAPVVDSLDPTEGFAGDTITLRGSYLADVDEVRVGGQIADFTVSSASELSFVVPEGSTGQVDVVAVTEGQESAPVSFTVLENAAPVIESFSVDQTRLDIGRTLTLSWQVSDADSAGLTCEIDWGNGLSNKTVGDCSTVTEATYMYGEAGTYTIDLAVSDGESTTHQTVTVEALDAGFSASTSNLQVQAAVDNVLTHPKIVELNKDFSSNDTRGFVLHDLVYLLIPSQDDTSYLVALLNGQDAFHIGYYS